MGRDLGRAVPRGCRALRRGLLATVLASVLVAATASAAGADDPTPTPTPVGTSVSPPSQQQIDDARNALERLRQQGTRATAPALAEVAGPTAQNGRGSVASRISDEAWWTVGAALLVLVVASETTRLSVRRAKHRREA